MMTGVGEAPCEILSYESDGLPAEYRGQLLVTSWADHRVERYTCETARRVVHGRAAAVRARRQELSPDRACASRRTARCSSATGCCSNYTLHGKGAIWHVRWKDAPQVVRPDDPKKAIGSMHRPLRESAAKSLAASHAGRLILSEQLATPNPRIRASILSALADVNWNELNLASFARSDPEPGIRELSMRSTIELGRKPDLYLRHHDRGYTPAVFAQSLPAVDLSPFLSDKYLLSELMTNSDPFLRHAAAVRLGRADLLEKTLDLKTMEPEARLFTLIAERQSPKLNPRGGRLKTYLGDSDETIRFLAIKWIADEKLSDFRKDIEKAMADPKISVRMYTACATARSLGSTARMSTNRASPTTSPIASRMTRRRRPCARCFCVRCRRGTRRSRSICSPSWRSRMTPPSRWKRCERWSSCRRRNACRRCSTSFAIRSSTSRCGRLRRSALSISPARSRTNCSTSRDAKFAAADSMPSAPSSASSSPRGICLHGPSRIGRPRKTPTAGSSVSKARPTRRPGRGCSFIRSWPAC